MPIFDPNAYGPAFSELLRNERLNPLGPGKPNPAARPLLDAMALETAFAGREVRDGDMAKLCLSAVWLNHNYLDESHVLSQKIETQTGSYWHGLMHRREPDYSNCKYWFRRVGIHPVFPDLCRAAAELAAACKPHPATDFLRTAAQWEPFAFIDLVEASADGRVPADKLCRQLQKREWEILFDYTYKRALGIDT